ncbi:MAG: hypothetical protein H6909_01490 [Rickettsiaceae bacterium]|nr:hypothetical protein [Rickettsiaceae bacterium]
MPKVAEPKFSTSYSGQGNLGSTNFSAVTKLYEQCSTQNQGEQVENNEGQDQSQGQYYFGQKFLDSDSRSNNFQNNYHQANDALYQDPRTQKESSGFNNYNNYNKYLSDPPVWNSNNPQNNDVQVSNSNNPNSEPNQAQLLENDINNQSEAPIISSSEPITIQQLQQQLDQNKEQALEIILASINLIKEEIESLNNKSQADMSQQAQGLFEKTEALFMHYATTATLSEDAKRRQEFMEDAHELFNQITNNPIYLNATNNEQELRNIGERNNRYIVNTIAKVAGAGGRNKCCD